MSCQHIGERNGLPCLRQDPDHTSDHIYTYVPKARKPESTKRAQALNLPEGKLPAAALAALARYSANGLEQEGDTMAAEIRRRLA